MESTAHAHWSTFDPFEKELRPGYLPTCVLRLLSLLPHTHPLAMLTIRKKLAEQAASGDKPVSPGAGSQPRRKLSFRSQLLTAEASELGGSVIPSTASD